MASFPAVSYGKLFYRQLEFEKITALRRGKYDFYQTVHITDKAIKDIIWWQNNIAHECMPISRGQADLIIESDASTRSYGYYCKFQNVRAGGEWRACEATSPINVLELNAAYSALQSVFFNVMYPYSFINGLNDRSCLNT